MGFLERLLSFGKNQEELPPQTDDYEEVIARRSLRLSEPEQREKYINGCLEQMRMASDETDLLNAEYNNVTTYLKDMEEIESLPETYSNKLKECAKKLMMLEKARLQFAGRRNKLTDEQYHQMERLEGEMPEGYQKLKDAEAYQKIVSGDMSRIEGEKQAYFYQENELVTKHNNLNGIAIISLAALGVSMLMLLLLFLLLELDVRLGAIVTVAVVMVVLTLIFVSNQDTMKELRRVRLAIAKLIGMQNTIKIRYVNNANLVDYLRMKFVVKNAEELNKIWELYLLELGDREKMEQNDIDYEYYQSELLHVLNKLHIAYPDIWLHQTAALIEQREMVEIRHGLIERRQQLRKQLDYNRNMAEDAQKEIKDIAKLYPKDSLKILRMLEEYEKK